MTFIIVLLVNKGKFGNPVEMFIYIFFNLYFIGL